ncbi:hypothetical protein IFM89_031496 [Coptis chinensis]|uniref:2-hydroxyacyl-CoA lyase n=1 Tax=Coptis chinensis TaxID=261450 RepID=A0A835HL27_9MAGN|nr:hypothetical protein IFM89_031496 [Coptis chinensis]
MDVGRISRSHCRAKDKVRCRNLGTMGVGRVIASLLQLASPNRHCCSLLKRDSRFGFSAMEVETLVRYQLCVVVIVFNNGGVYGVQRYHLVMEAFGGKGYLVGTPEELKSALANVASSHRLWSTSTRCSFLLSSAFEPEGILSKFDLPCCAALSDGSCYLHDLIILWPCYCTFQGTQRQNIALDNPRLLSCSHGIYFRLFWLMCGDIDSQLLF